MWLLALIIDACCMCTENEYVCPLLSNSAHISEIILVDRGRGQSRELHVIKVTCCRVGTMCIVPCSEYELGG